MSAKLHLVRYSLISFVLMVIISFCKLHNILNEIIHMWRNFYFLSTVKELVMATRKLENMTKFCAWRYCFCNPGHTYALPYNIKLSWQDFHFAIGSP